MEEKYVPKNIRQIGQVVKEPKIYIEDYVITFARKLSEKNKNEHGIAVLLGKEDKKSPVFIKGAVGVFGWDESGGIRFNNEVWSNIYEGVKNYFPDLEIVGWMVLRSGQELGFDEKIKAIHENNFAESGNILFVYDKEEKEENIYYYENLGFEKQTGYYIYYEKNEEMQTYMIDVFGNKSQEMAVEDKVIEQVRGLVGSKENGMIKRNNNLMYAASTTLAVVLLVIGVTTLSNYGKMENMEKTLNHISANIKEQEHQVGEYLSDEKTEEKLVIETITATVNDVLEMTKEDKGDLSADETKDMEKAEGEKTEEVMSTVRYYIVQKGDTLGSISEAVYASVRYVEEIQRVNNIGDKDKIFEGQKLIMP